ncbi:MAG: YfbK domain-containing protein [Roseibacillus sp.]
MKKEEIDDRLMDALLRGESDVNLAEGVDTNAKSKVRRGNFVRTVLAVAAMVLFAAIAVLYSKKGQDVPSEPPTLAVESMAEAEARLAELDALIRAQEEKVEAKRKVLDTIVRITGRPHFHSSSNSSQLTKTQLKMMAEKNAFEMKKNRDQYGIYLNRMETLDDEQVLRYAAELPVDNNSVRGLHQKYEKTEGELEQLKASGLGERHPSIVVQENRLNGLKEELESSVGTLREGLRTNYEMISEQLLVMEGTREEKDAELVELATEMHDYKEAEREYESALAQLQEAKLKHSSEKVALRRFGAIAEAAPAEKMEAIAMNASRRPAQPSSPAPKVLAKLPSFGKPSDFGDGWGRGAEERAKMRNLNIRGQAYANRAMILDSEPGSKYAELTDQPWKNPLKEALSTFSVDVDTASYTNIRRMLRDGVAVPKDAVRIEELVNYFDYNYPQPDNGEAFGVGLEMATCPWEPKHNLVRVALQGKDIKKDERGAANLVFLIDVSGSMQDSDKLPLLVESLGLLVEELQEEDRVAIVVYAGSEGVALEPTKMGQGGREKVAAALGRLSAGGSTNGGAGIELAYRLAKENFVTGGINRVILATDGDFNVGTTSREALVELVKKEAQDGVFLSVCGFGRGNLNDSMLEAITNDGNGVYYYVDSLAEGRRVFLEKLTGTLVTIAKDVKIQVEFNPAKVGQYRLIGYANRVLKKEDFNNDMVDAGDVGSGHQVTAFYEVVPVEVKDTVRPEVDDLKYQEQVEVRPKDDSPDWMTVKLRHKAPDGEVSKLQQFVLQGDAKSWTKADGDFQFASGVALWGMGLRGALGEDSQLVLRLLGQKESKNEERVELRKLVAEVVGDVEGGFFAHNQTDNPIRFLLGSMKVILDPHSQVFVALDGEPQNEPEAFLDFIVEEKQGGNWRRIRETRLRSNGSRGRSLEFSAEKQRVRVNWK